MAVNMETAELTGLVQALGPEEALGNLKVGDLKGCCRRFGLKATGGKLDLLGRLGEYLLRSGKEAVPAEASLPTSVQPEEKPAKKRGRPPKVPQTHLAHDAPSAREVAPEPAAAVEQAAAAGGAVKRRKTSKGNPHATSDTGLPADDKLDLPGVPTPLRNSSIGNSMAEGDARQALTVVFSAATAVPKISTEELPEATLEMGPERSAKMLLGLNLPEIRHYCVGLGLPAQGSKLELIDELLACLHVRWEEAKRQQQAVCDGGADEGMVQEEPAPRDSEVADEEAVRRSSSSSFCSPEKVQSKSETGKKEASDEPEVANPVVEDTVCTQQLDCEIEAGDGPASSAEKAHQHKAAKEKDQEVDASEELENAQEVEISLEDGAAIPEEHADTTEGNTMETSEADQCRAAEEEEAAQYVEEAEEVESGQDVKLASEELAAVPAEERADTPESSRLETSEADQHQAAEAEEAKEGEIQEASPARPSDCLCLKEGAAGNAVEGNTMETSEAVMAVAEDQEASAAGDEGIEDPEACADVSGAVESEAMTAASSTGQADGAAGRDGDDLLCPPAKRLRVTEPAPEEAS